MKKEKKYLYMEVTADEYELPIAVAGSGAELARMKGLDPHSVYRDIYRKGSGKMRGSKYVKVKCEETDDEDET